MKKSDVIELLTRVNSLTFISFFDFFKSSDDIILLKFDGARKINKYTIVILGNESRFEAIRYEGDDFLLGIKSCLERYIKYLE